MFPLIPAYVCFITGLSSEELTSAQGISFTKKRLILGEALLFILGFSFIFVVLGASATFLGSYFTRFQKWIKIIGGIIVILFGLHISGVLRLRFLEYQKKIGLRSKPATWLGSFFIGMAFGFGWTPCVGPILGGILMLAATSNTLAKGIMLLSLYSLGLALPFFLISIGIKWTLNLFSKLKRHFRLISVLSGILLIIIGMTILIPAAWADPAGWEFLFDRARQDEQSKEAAPDFALPTLDGETLQLSDFKGKIIILNFWAMSCPACRRLIPDLVKLYDKYRDDGLIIIGVNFDTARIERIKIFSDDMNINYPVIRGDYALAESYGGVRYIPTAFIIDKEMNIVKKFVGYASLETFESQIKGLLNR